MTRTLSDVELAKGIDDFRKCDELIKNWLRQGDCEISKEAWEAYYTLWGPEKLVYRLGEFICSLLIQYGSVLSVSECMSMEPFELFEMAKRVIDEL